MEIPFSHVLLFSVVLVASHNLKYNMFCSADPTDGFTELQLTDANFEQQKPYDDPLEERYSFVDMVRKSWAADDRPHVPSSHTQPCTEVWIKGLDYSLGVWQFEGHGFMPNGTSGAMIAQIHGAAHGATALTSRIYDGDLRYYSENLIATGLYHRWFGVNIIHDVDGGKVTVFLDGNQVFQVANKGPGDLHFKCGVYGAPAPLKEATSWNQGGETSKSTSEGQRAFVSWRPIHEF